ncbi:MAG TPA: SufE family protein [Chitinispirillaceae bacterium]|nr:SufE family protein [Chitinispirillaceae bacterium]
MTINEIQDSIIGDFSRFGDYLARYEYITELGKSLASTEPSIRTDQYALRGCQSQVWIKAQMRSERIVFTVDSDSLIIRGILVLIIRVINNRKPADIVNADLYFIKEIGSLSPSRTNGISSIIKTIRHLAEEYLN